MFSAIFAAASDCRRFSQAAFEYFPVNRKRILKVATRIFSAGLLFLIVLLSAERAYAVDVTLAWDPNNETDLEGYGVYFKKGTPGPPYDLFGYITTDELSNPDNPMSTVTGLDKGARYYFAVTAYDTEGNESYFSNSVCADVGDAIVPCPSGGGGGSSGGGSGGGAGCFIETASADAASFSAGSFFLAALGCVVAGFCFVVKRRSGRVFLVLQVTPRESSR
jgi:hypothetical protein